MNRPALLLALALASCRCGSPSTASTVPPVDAGRVDAGSCCYLLHDAGTVPCGQAVCNPQMPVPCSYEGKAGSVGGCP